ncbi:hypothetical protein H9Q69_003005 [Fusarium xylarioides]|nr:hypothetical protein H9Q69_003005 [Fusarium xylarioides]
MHYIEFETTDTTIHLVDLAGNHGSPLLGETKNEDKKDEDEKGDDDTEKGKRKASASDNEGSPSPGFPRPI